MKLFNKYFKTLPDVSGKVFVITGTTSGTGFVAARTVALKGGQVVLLNRASSRLDESLKSLKKAVPNGNFTSISCDLQDFASVREAAKEIQAKYKELYCLANNAGIMASPDAATKDGYDVQMQTNHLSHFLLTHLLLPLLTAGAKTHGEARIVNHSSGARHMIPDKMLEEKYFGPNGGNLGGDKGNDLIFSGPRYLRYKHSKLANSVFTHALHGKIQESPNEALKAIRVMSCHPGVAGTNLSSGSKDVQGTLVKLMTPVLQCLVQSPEDGSLGLVMGMMDGKAESGALYGPTGISGMAVVNTPQPHETDQASIDMLWRMSEAATGITFEV